MVSLFRFFARYCCTNDLSKDLEQLKKLEIIDASNLEYIANMAGIVVQETDTDEVRNFSCYTWATGLLYNEPEDA